MPERAHDMPMTRAERRAVVREIEKNRRATERRKRSAANAAYQKVLKATGDRDRAELVRASLLGKPAPVSTLTKKAAKKGRLPSPSLSSTAVRGKLEQAGVVPAIPVGGLVGQFGRDLVNTAIYTPAGVYESVKAPALDTADTLRGKPTAKRSKKLGKEIAQSTVDTVQHPLRHPGNTFLLGLGALSGGAGFATRVGAAGEAAATGGLRAALVRPGYEGGSLLRRPAPGMRAHRVGDLEVTGIHSAAPGVRHVEQAIDRARRNNADKGPVESLNIHAAGTALGQNRRVAEEVGRAHAHKLARQGKKLTRPQQQALRVWGQNLTPDEKILAYKRNLAELADSELPAAAKAEIGKALADKIALTEAARPYFKRGTSELADTFTVPRKKNRRRGANPAEMKAVAEQAQRVAGEGPSGRERALLDAGVIEPEQISFRRDAPGRLALGAEWTTAAQEAVRKLDQIETERAAVKGQPRVVPGEVVEVKRPRTKAEAEARLGALDEALNPLIDAWATEVRRMDKEARKGGGTVGKDKYEYFIDMYGKKEGARIAGLPDEDRLAEGHAMHQLQGYRQVRRKDPRDLAEEMLSQVTGHDPTPGMPTFDVNALLAMHQELTAQGIHMGKLKRAIDERDELRGVMRRNQPGVNEMFGEAPDITPDYGTVTARTRTPDRILPPELGEEAIAKLADLDRREAEAFALLDRGTEPHLTGAEGHRGRIRVPDEPAKRERKQTFGPAVYRGGQPRPPQSLRKGYTGKLEASGRFRVNTTQEIARSALEARKYTNLLELRQAVLASGVKARPADTRLVQWLPVREKRLTPKQRRMLAETNPKPLSETALETTAAEAQAAGPMARFLEDLFPREAYRDVPVGGEVPNVVWVPKQFLHDLNAPFQRQNPALAAGLGVLDTTLNLIKFGIIPLKTAYITANAAGNVLFNIVQQGVLMPRNWKRAVTLLRDPDIAPLVREVMGSGGMKSLVDGNPKGVKALNDAMHAYGNVMSELMAEPMMRVSSLVHEANRFGFKDKRAIHRLLTDPKLERKRDMIVRRANRAIVDYDRMGPLEKAVFRRVLFIYPWVKGATMYAGHFVLEHPVQSAVYSQVAEVGRERAQQDLGDVPSWAKGTFRVGGSNELPLTVNPATISPLSQAGEIADVGMGLFSPGGGSAAQFGGLLHPGIQSAIEAAYKRDTFTGAPLKGSTGGLFLGRTLGATAPATLLENLAKADRPPGRRSFPMTKTQAILRNTVGSFMPRTANRAALNESARREKEENLTPGQRARRSVFRERQAIFETMKQNDPQLLDSQGRLPAPVRKAYNRKAQVEAVRRQARTASHGDSESYYRDVAYREAKLLEQWGVVGKGFAAKVKRETANAPLDTLRSGVEKMRNDLMPDAYRDITSDGAKYLERRSGAAAP